MWIPRWLGEIYSWLYHSFETELFTFTQAEKALDMDPGKLSVAFSKLHSERILTVFRRSRPRDYRLLEPSEFVLLASGALENVGGLSQERYLPLVLKGYRWASKIVDVESFAVYGSVARGRAREDSDVDVLIISDDFHGSLGSRIERLMGVEDAVRDEIRWLRGRGIRTGLSFYPLSPREAEGLPSLFLDLTEDAVILHDEGRHLEGLLMELGAKLIERGAVRVFLDEDRWYWDLKPDYRFGETVEIA